MALKGTRVRARLDLTVLVPVKTKGRTPQVTVDAREALDAVTAVLGRTRLLEDLPDEREAYAGPDVLTPAGDVARLQMIEPLSVEWTRNPPSVPDTCSVTFRAATLPVDLRVMRGAQVGVWLYCHEDLNEDGAARAARCQVGDRGYFAGVVDVPSRSTDGRTITLECRDFTALPLATTLDLEQLDDIGLDQALPDIVRKLIDFVPGGDQWEIVARGSMAALGVPAHDLADERRTRVAARDETVTVGGMQDQAGIGNLRELLDFGGVKTDIRNGYRIDLPNADAPDGVEFGWVDPNQALAVQLAYRKAPTVTRTIPAHYVSKLVPPTWAQLLGSADNVWDAISRLCQLMGAVAEVAVLASGKIGVVIVDAAELQLSDVLRRFERDGSNVRSLTYGANVTNIGDARQLTGGQRVDWVEVQAMDPASGKMRRARYGRDEQSGSTTDHGLTLTAHGYTNQGHLDKLAQTAWLNANSGELELTVTTDDPWTDGGSVDDADLFGAGSGSVFDLEFTVANEAGGTSLDEALRALGVPPDAAEVLAAASENLAPSLRFQAVEVVHAYSQEGDGGYSVDVTMQTFLDDGAEHGAISVGDIL